jgi:hypothetical protein
MPARYAAREYLWRLASLEKVRPAIERLRRERPRELGRLGFLVRLQVALLAELGGATPEKLTAAGLDPSTVGAVYGLGMSPVVRVRLSDPARFAGVLDRMAARIGPVERAALAGQRYYAAREESLTWIAAVAGSDLVLALIPSGQRAALLPLILGQRAPERSLAADRTLDRLVAAYGFSTAGIGYADLVRWAGLLGASLRPPCSAELGTLALAVPRVAIGLTSASADEMRARSIVEVRPDLPAALMAMRGEAPRADPASAPPLEIAAAIDLGALTTQLGGALDRIGAQPFGCPSLAWLNDLARTQGGTLRRTARALANVRGASLAVRNIEAISTGGAHFFVLLGTERPGELLGQLASAIGAAKPSLEPGDPPVPLQPSPIGVFGPVHAGLGPRAVGLSLGAEPAELAEVLAAGTVDDPPLLFMHVDPQAVLQLLHLGVPQTGDARIAALDPELARQLAELEVSDIGRFDDVSVTARATARGLEVELNGRYVK